MKVERKTIRALPDLEPNLSPSVKARGRSQHQGRNPRAEARSRTEARNPNQCALAVLRPSDFGLLLAALARVPSRSAFGDSGFGFRHAFWLGAVLLFSTLTPGKAQVTWNRQAFGQTNTCYQAGNLVTYIWPNNANWSQTLAIGFPCGPGQPLTVEPSNWSTPTPPTNSTDDVVLGALGGGANLDLSVSINSLTIQAGGGLNVQYGTRISANAYNFQSDGAITIGGGGGPDPALSLFTGGTITKSGGTNTFTMDPGLVASATNVTITVASGTLALPGGSSSYSGGGTFNVTNGATLSLVPAGQNPTFSGTFTALGGGNVLFSAGNLYAGPGGLTLNAPNSMFQWSGGSFAVYGSSPFTNAGTINLSGGNVWGANFWNAGTLVQAGNGGLNIQGSSGLNNLAGALFELRNDAAITDNSGGGSVPNINNYGFFRKSSGTTNSIINPHFNNLNGTIEVDAGILTLAGGGVSSNATLIVSNSAALDLTGGNNATWAGQISGQGTGQVLLESGNLSAGPGGLILNLPGSLFQWTGGDLQCSDTLTAPFTNTAAMTISGGRSVGASFFNAGTMTQAGNGGLTVHGVVNNLSTGAFDLRNDAPVTTDVGGTLNNYGLFRKSAGTNSSIGIYFNNLGGTVEVDSGTLSFAGGGVSSNATLIVSNAATLDITGGANAVWSGLISGSGGGEALLGNGGTLAVGAGGLVLNLPGSLFQWAGGSLDCSQNPFTNSGSMIISSANEIGVNFWNQGAMVQAGTNGLNIQAGSGMDNLSIIELQNDAPITVNGGGGQNGFIFNYGLFRKSAGTSNSIVLPNLNNQSGMIEVDSGTLTLANNGTSSNATLVVSNAATLDLTGGANPTWSGLITGSGSGRVLFQGGNLNIGAGGLTADLPGSMFQWSGGSFAVYGSNPFTNANTMTLSGGNVWGDNFWNAGTMVQAGNGGLNIQGSSGINNLSSAVFDLQNDAPITANGGGGQAGYINNYGLFRKSAGTSNSVVSPNFNSRNGTIEVDNGELSLANNGTSSNATVILKNGGTLDLTGGANPTWSGLITATGTGTLLLDGGTIYIGPGGLTLNVPGSLFQWTGGTIAVYGSNPFTNAGTINLSGGAVWGGNFWNAGTMVQSGSGGLYMTGGGAVNNLNGALFDLQNDATVASAGGGFNNYGLLRKSAGTNVSSFGVNNFNNFNGNIEIDTGAISLNGNNYVQGTGAFAVKLGGTNSGQFGQLQCNNASLSGPLNVSLSGNFTPALGNQFTILSSSGLSGTFSSLNIPQGLSVVYTNNNVVLLVTSVPTQIVSPTISNGHFVFSFETLNGQTYTVQRNDDLSTTNWVFYTNFTGNGSSMQVLSPIANSLQTFFRVRVP